jgi:hypothetical protein
MNAPPFPPNPAVGQGFQSWVWNGSRWVCTAAPGIRIVTQVFPASAPYTPSPGLMSLVAETWGGGGGGGACAQAPNTIGGGGGGGSGGYSRVTLAAALVLGGVNVTIGAGGFGGNPPDSSESLPGGATSFGSMCVANGGLGGISNNSGVSWGSPGPGAPVGVGSVVFPGNPGLPGTSTTVDPSDPFTNASNGAGGAIAGGGGLVTLVTSGVGAAGSPGLGPGAGGSGAVINQASVGVLPGGTGGNGMCIVTEYCWADAMDDGGCGCAPTGGARVAIGGPQDWQGGFDND